MESSDTTPPIPAHICDICKKIFKSSSGLFQHQRNVHKISYELTHTERNLTCPKCFSSVPSKKQLEKHLFDEHGINIVKETLEFGNEIEFKDWKRRIEQETLTTFSKNCGSKKVKGIKYDYYYCFRSGQYRKSGKGERHLKVLGSNKINSVCPAMMKVSHGDVLSVEYVKTHIGHECDVGRLLLTEEEKQEIASKLANNIPVEAILDEVRDNLSDKLGRLDLLTRRDILNIKKQFNINFDGINHENDAESVQIWISTMVESNENSPVIYYKSQGDTDENFPCLKKNDFMLVIMNDIQREMLNTYGHDVVTCDFTHGMNSYNFDLATILIIDHKREGFPAAFIFSNRQDSAALTVAFKNIKTCGNINIKPKVFMSDDSESFYNAWCTVFGEVESRLLCSWHIDRSWRKNIEKFIEKKDDQILIYKSLRCLLSETDEQAFLCMLQNFLSSLQNNSATLEFSRYFANNYSKRCELWAYCYRKWAGLNTNMHIERMHRSIKYIYLKGRKARRLDVSIHSLMKFLRDKAADQLIALKRGKISSKVANIRKRHTEALKLAKDSALQQENEWVVLSSTTTELYNVSYNGPCTESCSLKCTNCSYCLHNYQCTCIDNSIQWNMCKHIHLICMIKNDSEQIEKNLEIDESYTEPLQNQEENILMNIKKSDKQHDNTETFKLNLNKMCQEMIASCSSVKECKFLEQKLKNVQTSFIGYKKMDQKYPLKRSFPSAVFEPSNKRIKKQGFFSTKKRIHRSKKVLSKPSRKESSDIINKLLFNFGSKEENQ